MVYLIKKEFAKDENAKNWEVEMRDHLKSINYKHISFGIVSGNLFDVTLQGSVIKDMF
jgi:hypothetical protein